MEETVIYLCGVIVFGFYLFSFLLFKIIIITDGTETWR